MTDLLLVTAEEPLHAELARLAAAAGVEPVGVRTAADGLRAWSGARTVLVGADLAPALAGLAPPRRERVHVVTSSPADPPLRAALACSAESVLTIPVDSERLVSLVADAADGAGTPALTVGVVGGVGGAGATVFAAAVAGACSERGPTALLDLDPMGAGADQVLGLEPGAGVRWDALVRARGRLGGRAIREALPSRDGLAVLAWPGAPVTVEPETVREVLSASRRGFETVVLDLARHPEPVGEEVLPRCDRVLLVSTRTVPAIAACERVLARLPAERTALVLRGRGIEPDRIGSYLGAPVAVAMADQRGLDEAIDLGAGPLRRRRGPLARAARQVAEWLRGDRL